MIAWCLAIAGLWTLAYTYVGYPLLVALLARRSAAQASAPTPARWPAITVGITVHNGQPWLGPKLASVLAQSYPGVLEVRVYLDGCTDGSLAIAQAASEEDDRVIVLARAERGGKPRGLNRIAQSATGDLLVFMDVRQTLGPGALQALARTLADPNVGCATGSLTLKGATGAGAYWRYERWIRSSESRFRGMVGATGALLALRRADYRPVPTDLILDDMWIPLRLLLDGAGRTRLCHDATVTEAAFTDGREFARKVRTLAGNYQLMSRLPSLWLPIKNPLWFELISHKVMRLACPWALVVMLSAAPLGVATASTHAERAAFIGLATLQGVGYSAALLGPHCGGIGRLARTFVVLNGAALLGLWRWITRRQSVAW